MVLSARLSHVESHTCGFSQRWEMAERGTSPQTGCTWDQSLSSGLRPNTEPRSCGGCTGKAMVLLFNGTNPWSPIPTPFYNLSALTQEAQRNKETVINGMTGVTRFFFSDFYFFPPRMCSRAEILKLWMVTTLENLYLKKNIYITILIRPTLQL